MLDIRKFSDDIDYNLLFKSMHYFSNTDLYEDENCLILGYLFKTNYFFCEIDNLRKKLNLQRIIQLFPEIKTNFDELVEIENAPQNGFWSSRTIIKDLTSFIRDVNLDLDSTFLTSSFQTNFEDSQKLLLLRKIRKWFQNGEVGLSSISICLAAFFNNLSGLATSPSDFYDMRRCIKLVQYIPEIKDNINNLINNPNINADWKIILINVQNEHNHFIRVYEST